jgi:hypothetical protein
MTPSTETGLKTDSGSIKSMTDENFDRSGDIPYFNDVAGLWH